MSIIKSLVNYYVKGLKPKEKSFIELNTSFWKKQYKSTQAVGNKYVLVFKEAYPLILVGNAHISSMIAVERGLKLLFVIPTFLNKSMIKVLESYPNANFVFEDNIHLLMSRLHSYFEALRTIINFKTPEEVLAYQIDGLEVGDLIYDSYLSCGYATMKKVHTFDLFKTLQRFFYSKRMIYYIINHYNIEICLMSHTCGVAGGTVARYLIKNNAEVWERWVTLKKHTNINTLYDSGARPEMKYVRYMKSRKSHFIPLAEKHLNDRLENRNTDYGAYLPYQKEKRVFNNKDEFSKFFNLDNNKKNIFVMMHAFNDYPNSFGFSIYRDYYQWFETVLNIAQKIDTVNWIFKEHPGAEYYPTKDLDLKTVFSGINASNIRFIDGNSNFNTSSLKYIADVICTCIGTAGLEYAAFGIPCILGGKSWYAGFGFTIEPRNDDEFKTVLKNIDKIPRLNDEQIDMAKIIALLTFNIFDVTNLPDPFGTSVTFDADAQRKLSSEQIFDIIVAHRTKSSWEEKVQYINSIKKFIHDKNSTQFVDLDKNSFFRNMSEE